VTESLHQTPRHLSQWAAEFVLIVAGLSVALAADSVWEMRKDRVVAGEYLRSSARMVATRGCSDRRE